MGGIIAAALLKGLYPGPVDVGTHLSPNVGLVRGFFLEAITTYILVFIVLILTTNKKTMTGGTHAPVGYT